MTNISWNEISDRAVEFASKWEGETYEKGESQSFWSDFLAVFGVDRRRHGAFFEYAIKKSTGAQGFIDMFWPGKLLAEQKSGGKDLSKANIQAYEYLATMPDHDLPEAIVVSDFATFQFINLETREKVEFKLEDFHKHVKLFGFLLGQSSKYIAEQNPVNRKAAEAMAKLHNQLRDDNYTGHDLEVLLVRLVFILFADDSGIFDNGVLHEYLSNRTAEDGSDLGSRLVQVFQLLNTPHEHRQTSLDEAIASLPYVNGGLFAESIAVPSFNSAMRHDLLATMSLDWSKVSPAIFGSMFQGVMDEKQRRNLGAHYTSEQNILKVIKPLFLDELYEDFTKASQAGPRKKFDELRTLQARIATLKFLDPACGCGNFLVITYRELRRLEHKIVGMLSKNADQIDMLAGSEVSQLKVNVDQMYGIEIEEFPSLIAQTALWLTDHQMNMEYSHQSGKVFKRLPLTRSARIVNANALTTEWSEVVAPSELDYILGNPPFVGSKMMTSTMRSEVLAQFPKINGAGVLDFVSAWYAKATEIMKKNQNVQTALVSTNSITQGEQVPVLWQYLFDQGVHINFAHQTFKWNNDAKGNAAVHCVILGFSLRNISPKRIFEYSTITSDPIETYAKNINGYGIDALNVFIESRSKPLSTATPVAIRGSESTDDGNLLVSSVELARLEAEADPALHYVKPFIGGRDFINNTQRWILWLKNANPSIIRGNKFIEDKVSQVRAYRLASSKKRTQEWADSPSVFTEDRQPTGRFLVLPKIFSERRKYLTVGYLDGEQVIVNNTLSVVADGTLYEFGILSSAMHMAWTKAVCGRMKSDIAYSIQIVYNNFAWPNVTDAQKIEVEHLAQAILDARASHPNASLADLYDPLTMPLDLRTAHKNLDKAVDKLYTNTRLRSDAERVVLLFEWYQKQSEAGL